MRAFVAPLLLLVLLAPRGAIADEVKFKVRVVLATTQGDLIDPNIPANLKKYLQDSFGARYSSFRLLDSRVVTVASGNTGEVPLPDDSVLKLKYRGKEGGFIKLTMEIRDLKTTIRIKDGGLFFQAGHKYKNGMLILAILATSTTPSDEGDVSSPRPEPRPGNEDKDVRDRPIDEKKDNDSKK
jgi:hypothetical protein